MSAQGPEDLRAVHAARRELGPDYDDALLDSFVDRAEAQLRQRLEGEQLQGSGRPSVRRAPREVRGPVRVTLGPGGLILALANGVWGVLSSAVLTQAYHDHLDKLIVIWMVIAVADAAYLGARIAGRTALSRKRSPAIDPPARRPAPRQSPGRSTTT